MLLWLSAMLLNPINLTRE